MILVVFLPCLLKNKLPWKNKKKSEEREILVTNYTHLFVFKRKILLIYFLLYIFTLSAQSNDR